MDIERILRNTPSTLSVTFYGDSAPTDADSAVTVTITKPDGAALTTNAATTHGTTGKYSYVLAPQSTLRRLKLDWSGTFGGQAATLTTYCEIVGGYYFTLYEARNFDPLIRDNVIKYPDSQLEDARLFVESEFERICQRAFVPRGAYEQTAMQTDSYSLLVENPEILRIVSLKVGGVDWSSYTYRTDGSRSLWIVDGQFFPYSAFGAINIQIEYEYGQPVVPPDIKRAALKRMRSVVIGQTGRIDERATFMTLPEMGSFTLATPGIRGSFTGLPEVDKTLSDWIWAGGVSFG